MAVYNERPYLEESVQSILDQTFGNFEFIIVNDGSSDGSRKVLEQYKKRDDRIRLVHQKNHGVAASINRGLKMARGAYVAIMDGDDISHPERFERQVQFLKENPDIGVLGTAVQAIDAEGGMKWTNAPPTDPDLVAWKLLFNTCLAHPTVMMRRSVLEELGGYAERIPVASDYELWTRAVLETHLANLPDTLLKLRRHEGSVTVRRRREQIRVCAEAATKLHRSLVGDSIDGQIVRFLVWMETKGIEEAIRTTGVQDFASVHKYLRRLHKTYVRKFLQEEANPQSQYLALNKLNSIADWIVKKEGPIKGAFYRLKQLSIVTCGNVLSLMERRAKRTRFGRFLD